MKKLLLTFFAGWACSFSALVFFVWLLSGRSLPPDSAQLFDLLLLIGLCCIFFSLVVVLAIAHQKQDATGGAHAELKDGALDLGLSLLYVGRRKFLPLWISSACLVAGIFAGARFPFAAELVLLTGAATWFLGRPGLRRFVCSPEIKPGLDAPLLALLRLSDLLNLLGLATAVSSIGSQGEVRGFAMFALLVFIAFDAGYFLLKKLHGTVVFSAIVVLLVWCPALLLSLNYGLGAQTPTSEEKASKQECLERSDKIRSGELPGLIDPGRFVGCPVFKSGDNHDLFAIVLVTTHPGALGVEWRKRTVLPKAP